MSRPPVTARMYRGILGDCFLLTIGDPDAPREKRSHILIDCGVLQGVAGGKTRMQKIVADIKETTGGELDLVVVTHEHFDHISGFRYAWDIFKEMTIGALWFAWTEDPEDTIALALDARFNHAHRMLAAMQLALDPGHDAGSPDEDEERIVGLAGFVGPVENGFAADGAKAKRGSRVIYDNLLDKAGTVTYLYPGDVLDTPALHGDSPRLRAYALGPPRDYEKLKKDLPSAGPGKETYLAIAEGTAKDRGDASPFTPSYRWWSMAEGYESAPDFVLRRYAPDRAPCRFAEGHEKPCNHDCATDFDCLSRQDYRRIDDMLGLEAAGLALRLDSHTNNTSLVLAFELESGGDVLLFAADAQVGNWMSWDTVAYARKDSGEQVPVTTAELLARTRLYKVGHHGSHNATMKDQGLERMTHKGLIALIPTVEEVAAKQGKGTWQMPNPETYKALIRKTKGRILRGDKTLDEVRKGINPAGAETKIEIDEDFKPHREDENCCEVQF